MARNGYSSYFSCERTAISLGKNAAAGFTCRRSERAKLRGRHRPNPPHFWTWAPGARRKMKALAIGMRQAGLPRFQPEDAAPAVHKSPRTRVLSDIYTLWRQSDVPHITGMCDARLSLLLHDASTARQEGAAQCTEVEVRADNKSVTRFGWRFPGRICIRRCFGIYRDRLPLGLIGSLVGRGIPGRC